MSKIAPALISLLRIGSLVSGECSICHDILLSPIFTDTEPAGELIRERFPEHIRERHAEEYPNYAYNDKIAVCKT